MAQKKHAKHAGAPAAAQASGSVAGGAESAASLASRKAHTAAAASPAGSAPSSSGSAPKSPETGGKSGGTSTPQSSRVKSHHHPHPHHHHHHKQFQKFHQSLAYAAILLALVYLAFFQGGLAQDPAATMLQTVPVIIILQVWYCASGMLDGSNAATAPSAALLTTSAAKRKPAVSPSPSSLSSSFSGDSRATPVTSALLAAVLALMMSVLVFGLLILFGAPAASLVHSTFLCAVHISLLSVLPLVYIYNLDSQTWKDIISVRLPLNGVYGASVGTWVGAWLGAIPIPLDWDRPWQQWPITILVGSYVGTALGTLIGATYRKLQK